MTTGITDLSANAPAFTVSGVAGDTGTLAFTGTGTAADAHLTAAAYGVVSFSGTSDAGSAAVLTALSGGTIDFSGTTGSAGNNQVTAGSIAGAGNFNLGADTLTAGALDTSTAVDGVISGTGGGLVKVGNGTLTLSGVNTYTGGTSIIAGTLALSGAGSIASSSGVSDNGIFDISGTDSGASVQILGGHGNVILGGKTLTVGGGEIDGAITGNGGGIILNGGALELTGTNDYLTTTINGGFLVAGNGGAGGNLGVRPVVQNGVEADAGIIVDDGTLTFDRSKDFALEGCISGPAIS